MCDYSLMTVPNRLAVSGDELVVHRFQEGSMGLASAFDLRSGEEMRKRKPQGFWTKLKDFFDADPVVITAVCVPPGARLAIRDIPETRQREWGLQSSAADAVFTQITAHAEEHRDAVCFSNGTVVLLQGLLEGQRVRVVSVSSEEDMHTEPEYGTAARMA
jgi:hypothetical protein